MSEKKWDDGDGFYYAFVQEVSLADFSSNYELNYGPVLPYTVILKLQKDSNFLI